MAHEGGGRWNEDRIALTIFLLRIYQSRERVIQAIVIGLIPSLDHSASCSSKTC